jgi:hypothetical protein
MGQPHPANCQGSRQVRRRVGIALRATLALAVLAGLLVTTSGAPTGAAGIGDSTQSATLQFYVCPKDCDGIHVFVDSVSNHYSPTKKWSLCTKNETSTDFRPTYNGQSLRVSMVAKNGGSCFGEYAYNSWMVAVYKDNQLIGRGAMIIDENDPFTSSYFASCDPRYSPWKPLWDGLQCRNTSQNTVAVSVPGATPTWPDCPASTSMCAINLTVHSSIRAPCRGLTASADTCLGTSTGTSGWNVPTYSPQYGIQAWFGWKSSGDARQVEYRAFLHYGVQQAEITGRLSSPGSDRLVVTDAWIRQSPDRWTTGDSAPAGAPGGPLLFDFESGTVSNTISFQGFLRRK